MVASEPHPAASHPHSTSRPPTPRRGSSGDNMYRWSGTGRRQASRGDGETHRERREKRTDASVDGGSAATGNPRLDTPGRETQRSEEGARTKEDSTESKRSRG